MLRIYNTMTRKVEEFKPLRGNRVYMYVCGPTVYDYSHIGHARTYIAYDVLARYLREKGYSVFYLMNITDVDDKIIKRARERLDRAEAALVKARERYDKSRALLSKKKDDLSAFKIKSAERISHAERAVDKAKIYTGLPEITENGQLETSVKNLLQQSTG